MFKGLKSKIHSDRLASYIAHATNEISKVLIYYSNNNLSEKQKFFIFKEIWAYVIHSYLSVTSSDYNNSFIRKMLHKTHRSICNKIEEIDLLMFPEIDRDEYYLHWLDQYENSKLSDSELKPDSFCFRRLSSYFRSNSIRTEGDSLGTIFAYIIQIKNAFNKWYD